MKKTYLFTLFLFLFLAGAQAQQKRFATTLSLQSGVGIPLGGFASSDLSNSSFAQTGFGFGILAETSLTDHLSFGVQAALFLNPIDVSLLGYEKVQADPFLEDVRIRSEAFRTIPLLAGPSFEFFKLNKLSLTAAVRAGVFFSSTPYQLYKPSYFLVGPSYYEITSSSDISFAYSAAAVFRYQTKSCVALKLISEWMYSKATYGFISASVLRTEERPISLLNVSLALEIPLF